MAMPNPMYSSPGVYASPSLPPQMVSTPYYAGPSPYTPTMMNAQGYYPPMSAMQVSGQPVMYQQPYPVYPQRRCDCCDCCDCCLDCSCCLGIFASLCICCCCCGNEADECCC